MLIKGENIYDILGIDKNADKKTIKQAYAKLVKQYHPEEQPEEWKRIHDAYELAIELASGQKQKVAVPVAPEQVCELADTVKWPEQNPTPNESTGMPEPILSTPIETPRVQETESEDIFGDVERIADKQREEEEKAAEEKLKYAIHEVQSLVWQNKFKTKEWKKFFEQEDLLPVISQKKFLRELGDCFFLKQIDQKLYTYMNEQLNIIADYIKVYSTSASAGSMDMASVEYARSKVKVAYRSGKHEKNPLSQRSIFLTLLVLGSVLTTLSSGYVRSINAQRQKESQVQSREMREKEYEIMKQQEEEMQEQWQDMFEADPDLRESMIQHMREIMEEGSVKQEYIDSVLQSFGIDPSELEQ